MNSCANHDKIPPTRPSPTFPAPVQRVAGAHTPPHSHSLNAVADILEVRLLGPVQIQRAGQPIRGFESRKALALLCYLAACDQPLTRDHLADLFWLDKSSQQGRANLSRVLHNLNSLVSDSLEIDRHTVAFRRTTQSWLDVAAFGDLAARRTPAAQAAAAALYRGDFMSGVFLDSCPDFELWLVGARERWLAKVTGLLDDLVEHHVRLGTFAEGLDTVVRLLELEPWREAAHRQAMLLLAKSGRPAEALAQYEACCRALEVDLASRPSAETVALFEQIRAGEIGQQAGVLPHEPPHNLPIQLTSFVGREDELATIAARLADPACRLLTVVGPGGIGKTRLALEAAHRQRWSFPDGVFLVGLNSVATPALIASTMASALKLTLSPQADPKVQLLEHLRDKVLLVVLDGLEHLLDGVELLLDVLRTAPAVNILCTSRERLNLQAEWLLPIDGLAVPESDDPDVILDFASVQLYTSRARQVQPRFALTQATGAPVARTCRLVEGMPLAIELACARVGEIGCDAVADMIAHGVDFLATSMSDVPARHRSVRAVFEQSWRLLSAADQRVFAQLSVFRGGLAADAAGEVALASAQNLSALTDCFLIRQSSDGRIEVHELLRQFAAEKLSDLGQDETLRQRHLAYYLTRAEDSALDLRGPNQVAALERLEAEHDNLRAALHYASASGDPLTALRLGVSLCRFWMTRGHCTEGRARLEGIRALPGAEAFTPQYAAALDAAGTLAYAQADYAAARLLVEEGLTLRRELGDKAGIAGSLNNLANVLQEQGDRLGARRLYEESLAHERELGNQWGIAGVLNNLGNIVRVAGDLAAARLLYEESLALERAIGNTRGVGLATINIGVVAYEQRDYPAARAHFEASLDVFQELGDESNLAGALMNLGYVAHQEGDFATARSRHEAALALKRKVDDKWGIADALNNLGAAAQAQGDGESARALHLDGLNLSREVGNMMGIAESLESIGWLVLLGAGAQHSLQLLGATESLRQATGIRLMGHEQPSHDQAVEAAQSALGEIGFEAAWSRGRAMSLDEAVALALEPEDAVACSPGQKEEVHAVTWTGS